MTNHDGQHILHLLENARFPVFFGGAGVSTESGIPDFRGQEGLYRCNEEFGEYIHMGGKIAVLTIVNNANEETAKDVSMHAAAMRPLYVKRENVPTEEANQIKAQLEEAGAEVELA